MDTSILRKTGANSTYKKLAVQWLNEALCFVSSSVVADSLVLRNRQLLVAANRNMKKKQIILFILFLILIGYLTRKSMRESIEFNEYENEMLRVQDSIMNVQDSLKNLQ